MKKILALVMFLNIIFAATATYADSAKRCTDGTLVEGVDKYEYCKSKVTMNWWSAFAWCKAQGRELFSILDCATDEYGADGYTPGEGICHNVAGKGTDWVWISLASGTNLAYRVDLSSGALYNIGRDGSHYGSALCK